MRECISVAAIMFVITVTNLFDGRLTVNVIINGSKTFWSFFKKKKS